MDSLKPLYTNPCVMCVHVYMQIHDIHVHLYCVYLILEHLNVFRDILAPKFWFANYFSKTFVRVFCWSTAHV